MEIAIIGGTGGLGKQLTEHLQGRLKDIKIHSLSSKDLDVGIFKQCEKFFNENQIDVVINLSGVNYDKFIHKFEEADTVSIIDLLFVNLLGSVHIAATALPPMRERGYGRLIYISSVLSTKIVLGTGLYSSGKAFIDRLVKSISAENISKGITCNSIQLGYFDGGLTYKLPNPEKYKAEIPLKRWGRIEELTDTIEYIIKTEYLTGTNIPLNGGA